MSSPQNNDPSFENVLSPTQRTSSTSSISSRTLTSVSTAHVAPVAGSVWPLASPLYASVSRSFSASVRATPASTCSWFFDDLSR